MLLRNISRNPKRRNNYAISKNQYMSNFQKLILIVISISLTIMLSCNSSSVNPEKKVAVEIANESCSFISEITSSAIVGALGGTVDDSEQIDFVSGFWCECYTYYISKDLMEKFTIKELREIKNDNIKKIMVLSEIFKDHQKDIKNCIALTTNEKIKNYADFERKLNRKLKE